MPEQEGAGSDRGRLLQEREALYRKLAEVESRIARVSRREMAARALKPTGTFRPVRGVVLDCLDDLGWPAYSREIAAYAEARYGRRIVPTRFGVLMVDETEAYLHREDARRRPRTVWLCPTLTWDYAEPIKRLLSRSDWPLEQRIVAPTTGRVQYLTLTVRLCEIALKAADTAADPEMLRTLAADHARDLVGVDFRRGQFPLEEWSRVASSLLAEAAPRDLEMRTTAAERFRRELDERSVLFGRPEELIGIDQPIPQMRAR